MRKVYIYSAHVDKSDDLADFLTNQFRADELSAVHDAQRSVERSDEQEAVLDRFVFRCQELAYEWALHEGWCRPEGILHELQWEPVVH